MSEEAVQDGLNWMRQPDGSIWRWDPATEGWLEWRPAEPGPQPPRTWAKERTKQLKDRARHEQREATEKAKAEKEFWSSPQGRARAARMAGETLFQITLPVSSTEKAWFGDTAMLGASTATRTREQQQAGPLELIEQEGWDLEYVGYAFQPTGTQSRDRLLASGQVETIIGQIIGVYLFRADGVPGEAPNGSQGPQGKSA